MQEADVITRARITRRELMKQRMLTEQSIARLIEQRCGLNPHRLRDTIGCVMQEDVESMTLTYTFFQKHGR